MHMVEGKNRERIDKEEGDIAKEAMAVRLKRKLMGKKDDRSSD